MKKSGKIAIYHTTRRDQLHTGEILHVDQRLTSQNGKFFAIVQGDANFVVYTKDGHPIWASNTHGKGAGHIHLICQADGNLVLYNPSIPGHN